MSLFTVSDDADVLPGNSWLALYAGIMTILLAFFLSLFCTGGASSDSSLFEAAKSSVASALGSQRNLTKKEPPPGGTGSSVPLTDFERLVMGPGVTMYRIRHGMAVAVPASLLFMKDGITPSGTSREILDKIAAYARAGSTRLAVECCEMSANDSREAWDISLRRALAIGNYLSSQGVDTTRICPIGKGRTPDSLEQDAGNNVIISFYYE